MAMYTFESSGFLKNLKTEEEWKWDAKDVLWQNGVLDRVTRKLFIFLKSVVAFIIVSNITALIVRTITSAGVACIYPFMQCFRCASAFNEAYPWLGTAMNLLETETGSSNTFVWGHICQTIVYYMMYEASELAWNQWIYTKSFPAGLNAAMFGIVMLWEYFSMLFLRSETSIRLFPFTCFISFLWFHIYFFSFTYGLCNMAIFTLFTFSMAAMVYFVAAWEIPALRAGKVDVQNPRQLFTRMEVPYWTELLPPTWTLYAPLNAQSTSVYEVQMGSIENGFGE